MRTKLIITEQQMKILKKYINENIIYEKMIEVLVSDLNRNYEPMSAIVRENGEYFEKPMIKVKVDDTEISVKDLYEYFIKKYKLGEAFTKQVITDWMFGTLKGNQLSKNVPLN